MQDHTPRSTAVTFRGVLGVALVATLTLAACGGAGAPVAATAAPTTAAPTTRAPATTPAAATVTGTISKLADEGKEVTVKTADGKEIVFEISSSRTTFKDDRPGGTAKSRKDLQVGMKVTVTGPAAGGEAKTFTITG